MDSKQILKKFFEILYIREITIDELSHIRFDKNDYICPGQFRGLIPFQKEISSTVDLLIVSLPELPKNNLVNLKKQLLDFCQNFEEIKNENSIIKIQKDLIVEEIDPYGITNTVHDIKPVYLKVIEKFWNLKELSCQKIITAVEDQLHSIPEILEINKLELKLSVADIALLFRLLDEEKLLKYKNKTEIYRFISHVFKTENQENISEASIKNKFLSPDNTALKNNDILLINLKQHLKKIQ